MDQDLVVLVDTFDRAVGEAPKLLAHQEGLLHRAVSVLIFNAAGQLLLQRRAEGKYHSGGLWSNACCTHPRVGEDPIDAATRRLREELGLEASLRYGFSFLYRADVGAGLTEHELDHAFFGETEDDPRPDPSEVQDWRWIDPKELRREMMDKPHLFTAWLPILMEKMLERPANAGAERAPSA